MISVDREYMRVRQQIVRRAWLRRLAVAMIGIGALFALAIVSGKAHARWKAAYGSQPLEVQQWYKQQHNAQGQWCCDEGDGHRYDGPYTINRDGSVTLHLAEGDHTLPSYMVLTGPNPTGAAVWWFIESGAGRTDFCFAPGTLT